METQDYFITEHEKYKFAYEYRRPAATADNVIFGFDGQDLKILLIKRGEEPYKDFWALPGGFLQMGETIEECARRELQEETGLAEVYAEHFGVFSDVNRDPRGRVVTVAFFALVRTMAVRGGDDAAEARWFGLKEAPRLAFDHDMILRSAQEKLRESLHFRPIGFELLGEKFSIAQLQRLYEAILNVHFDRRNFTKKMLSTEILIDLNEKDNSALGRPANLYSFNLEKYQELKSNNSFKLEF